MQVKTQDSAIAAALDNGLRESAQAAQSPAELKRMIEAKIDGKVVVRRDEDSNFVVQRQLNG